MYYPYLRGKQFELIAIRESADLIARSRFIPIIEPVRESLVGLERALKETTKVGAETIVVVNPQHGHHKGGGTEVSNLLKTAYSGNKSVRAGVLLTSEASADEILALLSEHPGSGTTLIHSGFTDSRTLSTELQKQKLSFDNVFLENQTNRLYRRHFPTGRQVIIGDGFIPMKNSAYSLVDNFSDLHVTYRDMGMTGYGDFLTIGDKYSEGGGPAYAVAIHLTFIDPAQDNAMFVYHFKSDTNDTPTDPAGKFSQALEKLIAKLDRGDSNLLRTSAIDEFATLHERQHFPGLGYVKKLSIKHHLETLADYHQNSHG